MAPLSVGFILFLLVGLSIYYLAFRDNQWIWLLVLSLFFCLICMGGCFLVMLSVAFITWAGALLIVRYNKIRKALLFVFLGLDLSFLFFFKNISFIKPEYESVLTPLGISFYTFIALSYLIDVYNNKYSPERNFFKTLLFISYFPQIAQGPINRWNSMQELFKPHRMSAEIFERSMMLIVFGLMKKYAIADMIGGMVDAIFDYDPQGQPGSVIALGIVMFAIQEYTDFSGGIDVVIGVSGLFGIPMAQNFRQPYFSRSLAEFWRRWHITLGTWMKEYVFFPFALTKMMQNFSVKTREKGGRFLGRVLPACVTNLLVFFIVGIWHGRDYIAWGLYNGAIIVFSDLMAPVYKRIKNGLKIDDSGMVYRRFQVVRTFIIVGIGWYFDRIHSFADSIAFLCRTIVHPEWRSFLVGFRTVMERSNDRDWRYTIPALIIAVISLTILFISSILKERGIDIYLYIKRKNRVLRWGLCYMMIFLTLLSLIFSDASAGFMYEAF